MTSNSLDIISPLPALQPLTQFLLQELLLRSNLLIIASILLITLFSRNSASVRSVLWLMLIAALALLPLFSLILPNLALVISTDNQLVSLIRGDLLLADGLSANGWLMLVYSMAALGGLIYLLTGIWQMHRISARASAVQEPRLLSLESSLRQTNGIECQVELLFSREVNSPLTWGIFQHRILLPENARQWPREMLAQCLSHELAHIQRMDWASHILSRLVLCLHWFNPLVWWLHHKFVEESEKACDEAVIDDTGCPVTYAENLLWFANTLSRNRACVGTHLFRSRSVLYRRIAYILGESRYRSVNGRSSLVAGLVFSMLLLAPLSALELNLVEPEQPAHAIEAQVFQVSYYPRGSVDHARLMGQFRKPLDQF